MSNQSPILQIFNESEEKIPLKAEKAHLLIDKISVDENAGLSILELVYVDEQEIQRLNQKHLARDYITDIITFRYDNGLDDGNNNEIEGTLFCCAPRIKEQAKEYNEPVEKEFYRIFIHGILHLIGYEDDSEEKKSIMSTLENKYLDLIFKNK